MLRVTSVEQLSLAEFSGEQTRPKVYENGHTNVPGIQMDSVTKVKFAKIRVFRVDYFEFYVKKIEKLE